MFEDDICHCGNAGNCPRKGECRRSYTLGPGYYSYADFYEDDKECIYFLPTEGDD